MLAAQATPLALAVLELLRSPSLHGHLEPFVRRAALLATAQVLASLPPARVAGAMLSAPASSSAFGLTGGMQAGGVAAIGGLGGMQGLGSALCGLGIGITMQGGDSRSGGRGALAHGDPLDAALVERLNWVQTWVARVAEEDSDDTCRALAAGCAGLHASLTQRAAHSLAVPPQDEAPLRGLGSAVDFLAGRGGSVSTVVPRIDALRF